MSLPAAFIGVILIWSTTPLAIQWSSETWGFLFSVMSRMTIGSILCILLLVYQRRKLALHRRALLSYGAAGLGIYGAMMCVYWGAQYISSGLVAVLFGLSPIMIAVLAALWLEEASLSGGKIIGVIFGILGLTVIYAADLTAINIAWKGVAGILGAVLLHSLSTVWLKRIGEPLPAIVITTGGLLVATPAYILTWIVFDGHMPSQWPVRDIAALLYLGVLASVVGFTFYFYVLKHMPASRVALIALITPVLALITGNVLNDEVVGVNIWIGTLFILFGLSVNQWGDNVVLRLRLVKK